MLKIRYHTEDWLELLVTEIVVVERKTNKELELSCYEDVANSLCCDVLRILADDNVDYQSCYTQKRGAQVILQDWLNDDERAAFDAAVEAGLKGIACEIERCNSSYLTM